jgi:hypothetical protein
VSGGLSKVDPGRGFRPPRGELSLSTLGRPGSAFGFNARRPTSRRLVAISTGSWVRPKAAPESQLLRDFMSRDESAEAHSTLVESESPTAQMAVISGAPVGDAREGAQETEDCLTSLEREPKCSICD